MKWFCWKKRIIGETRPYPSVKPYLSPFRGRRKRIPSQSLKRYYISLGVMEVTDSVFRKFTARNVEGYVWWTGYVGHDFEAQVCSVLYPEVETLYGRVHLDRKTMSAMHKKLIELDQILLAELHTHPPGAGGQNAVDAENAAIFYPGFVTIVVPNFARPRFYDLRDSFVYEYGHSGSWRQLNKNEISERFIIEESLVEVKAQ